VSTLVVSLQSEADARYSLFEMSTRMWWAAPDPAQRSFVMIPTISTLIYRADAAIYDVRPSISSH
jgi:hypothetical protein